MRFPGNIVTRDDTRCDGAGTPEKCFYCTGALGGQHDEQCVILQRPVRVRITFEIVVAVPRSHTKEQLEFHWNDSSWCTDNIMNDLARYSESRERCLCPVSTFEYLEDVTLEEAEADGLERDGEK